MTSDGAEGLGRGLLSACDLPVSSQGPGPLPKFANSVLPSLQNRELSWSQEGSEDPLSRPLIYPSTSLCSITPERAKDEPLTQGSD